MAKIYQLKRMAVILNGVSVKNSGYGYGKYGYGSYGYGYGYGQQAEDE